MIWKSDILLRP